MENVSFRKWGSRPRLFSIACSMGSMRKMCRSANGFAPQVIFSRPPARTPSVDADAVARASVFVQEEEVIQSSPMERGRQEHTLGGRAGLAQRGHAWLMARLSPYADAYWRSYKQALLSGLRGRVLEIGPGTGPNLRYYPPEVRWMGLEPNPYMHRYVRKEAERLGRDIALALGYAEHLDLEDESVDAVVSTYVLCTVSDPERALGEIQRVLVPGGRFLFIEHIAAPANTRLRRWQERLSPLWKRLADGCHPNRETDRLIRAAGFAQVTLQYLHAPFPLVSPHIVGVAVKGCSGTR